MRNMRPYWNSTDEERDALNRRDAELIEANIEYLNREAKDLLQYQTPIDWSTDAEQ
jgi:hypothetical protein